MWLVICDESRQCDGVMARPDLFHQARSTGSCCKRATYEVCASQIKSACVQMSGSTSLTASITQAAGTLDALGVTHDEPCSSDHGVLRLIAQLLL